MAPGAEDISSFYDNFLKTRMLEYRLHGNLRLEIAVDLILPLIHENSRILDLGCGIGIVSEQMARKASKGWVWACDISPQNVWYAKKTVRERNISFFEADFTTQSDQIARLIGEKTDIITMVDVLEHLPETEHRDLFKFLEQLLVPKGSLVLTFPTPAYQDYLRKYKPDELQIIDENIEVSTVVKAIENTSFKIRFYSMKDVWMKNQYAHCVLEKGVEVSPNSVQGTAASHLVQRIKRAFNVLGVYFKKRKYINNVFREEGR